MTRSELLTLAAAVERDGVAAHNDAVARAFGYVFCELWAPPGEMDVSKWTAEPPDFSNLQTAADHMPKGWIHAGGYFDYTRKPPEHVWMLINLDKPERFSDFRTAFGTGPDEASARNAASLRALAEDADA